MNRRRLFFPRGAIIVFNSFTLLPAKLQEKNETTLVRATVHKFGRLLQKPLSPLGDYLPGLKAF